MTSKALLVNLHDIGGNICDKSSKFVNDFFLFRNIYNLDDLLLFFKFLFLNLLIKQCVHCGQASAPTESPPKD